MAELSEVRNRIKAIFGERLHVDLPGDDVDLIEAGILDSLMFVDLLVHLEQDFGVRITPENLEIENFDSVIKIADFVLSLDGHKSG